MNRALFDREGNVVEHRKSRIVLNDIVDPQHRCHIGSLVARGPAPSSCPVRTTYAGDGRRHRKAAHTKNALLEKSAIVTGAASGIGREIALAFAREGAHVAVTDLRIDAAQATADEISAAGGRAIAVAMDVTDEAAVEAGVAAVAEAFGGIDILVSNAGIQIIHALDGMPYTDWKAVTGVHLDGAFLVTRACLPHMYASKRGGSVIYIGSVHSKLASPLKAPYVAAKHALLGLARVVAKEGAPHGVRANVVCPGFVRTPLVEKQIPEQAQALGLSEADVVKTVMLKDTVDGEFTSLTDVAATVVFFAGFPSNALTGQSLVVSHGWYME